MKLHIDGDACPSIAKITALAQRYQVETRIYCDFEHTIDSDYATVIQVDSGYQFVDMVIANTIEKGDILITQDYGLAVLSLSKGANTVDPKGNIYQAAAIDTMLYTRHLFAKIRKSGGHTSGPKKRTLQDEQKLLKTLEQFFLLWYNDK